MLAEPENTVTNIWRLLQSIRVSLLRRERWDTAIFWGISGLINDNYTSPATHQTDHLRAATFGGGQDKQKFGEHYMALVEVNVAVVLTSIGDKSKSPLLIF